MNLSAIQASIIALIGTIASLAVGFGAFSSSTEQLVVSAAGTLVSLVFTIVNEAEKHTNAIKGSK